MLVTRQFKTEHCHWPINKLGVIFDNKPSSSLRMSRFDTAISTQPDWQGQYSFLPQGENPFSQSYHQNETPNNASRSSGASALPGTTTADVNQAELAPQQNNANSPIGDRDTLDLRKRPSGAAEHTQQAQEPYVITSERVEKQESLSGSDAPTVPLMTGPSADTQFRYTQVVEGPEEHIPRDEEIPDDDDMVHGDEYGEGVAQPRTAAERTAQRRKMKRFRLTHQQTRFLMSEFAKQPHPDAAHRERLSREIPGLSPRQVQVWFQNRRAKIKRLTADDRDRMIKMRAVPDDFDNFQALHSPYGAVHGLGTSIASSANFGTPSYGDHMMRPVVVDVRRPESNEAIAPAGLSPSFGNVQFSPGAPMSNPDLLSPISPPGNDRYEFPNNGSTPPSVGARSSSLLARQDSVDLGNQPQMRNIQPLQLRDTMDRSKPESLQSPLRTSMSWKGNSFDCTYSGGARSPQIGGRHGSIGYSTESITRSSSGGGIGFDSNNYSSRRFSETILRRQHAGPEADTSMQSPPSTINKYGMQAPQNRPQIRPAPATLPVGLDLRNQYRPVSSLDPVQQSPSGTPRAATTQFGVSSAYTTSYPSTPLTAPIDFSLPRTTGIQTTQDYSLPQLSAPIVPPNDFGRALRSVANSSSNSVETPVRDSFGRGGFFALSNTPTTAPCTNGKASESLYPNEPSGRVASGLKGRRSFTMPQAGLTPTPTPQQYGIAN